MAVAATLRLCDGAAHTSHLTRARRGAARRGARAGGWVGAPGDARVCTESDGWTAAALRARRDLANAGIRQCIRLAILHSFDLQFVSAKGE